MGPYIQGDNLFLSLRYLIAFCAGVVQIELFILLVAEFSQDYHKSFKLFGGFRGLVVSAWTTATAFNRSI